MDLFSTNIAYAVGEGDFNNFIAKVDSMIINPLILFLFALAVVYFLYGVLQFFLNPDNEENKITGRNHMIWGIIGITIMLGVWTILGIILNTLGISKSEIDPENGNVELAPYNP